MLQRGLERTHIGKELALSDKHAFFDIKDKQFLHNIDTFYYSIKLAEDFRRESSDVKVQRYRRWRSDQTADSVADYKNRASIPGLEDCAISAHHFSKYYDLCITKEGVFDCFVASVVPSAGDGSESVTAEIIMQLRSEYLWQHSTRDCFDASLAKIRCFIDFFGFHIKEIKENRTDYCWHSNYIVNPEKYFDVRSLHERAVTRIHQGYMHWQDNADGYDVDYVALGKRSNKIFLRIYLKSKEVVEMGYKGWFLKLWQLQGMISRYDFYVYDLCYQRKDWKYLDAARLEFYLEYGADEDIKADIRQLLAAKLMDRRAIRRLADQLTPKVTLIMNVEFQVMRRASKQFELLPTSASDYQEYPQQQRVYQFLDNWQYITEYLTYDVFRMCENDNAQKSRRTMSDFWQRLRSAPIYAGAEKLGHLKITRNYQRKLDVQAMKDRFISSSIGLSLYSKGLNDDDLMGDIQDNMCILNDNDIQRARTKKIRRLATVNLNLLEQTQDELQRVFASLTCDDWIMAKMGGVDDDDAGGG